MVPSGVGSGVMRDVLPGIFHGIELVSVIDVRVMKCDWTVNSSDPSSLIFQTSGSPTQGHNPSANSTISSVEPATTSSSAQPLYEITEQVDHTEGCQEFCHLLASDVWHVSDVCVQVLE